MARRRIGRILHRLAPPSRRSRSFSRAFRFHPRTFPYEQRDNFAARATIDLPLYTGGRIEHGIAAAEADRAALALDAEDALMDLKMRVAEVYVTVLRAQRDVELTESTIRSLESHARDVEVLFRQGQVQQTDLLAAQVALANARCDGVQAKNRLDSSRAAYNRHLGRPLDRPSASGGIALGNARFRPGKPDVAWHCILDRPWRGW